MARELRVEYPGAVSHVLNRGVGVTYPEFEKAQELREKFWLYVVERADQPEARIHQIQDPARKVDQFMYDDGMERSRRANPRCTVTNVAC